MISTTRSHGPTADRRQDRLSFELSPCDQGVQLVVVGDLDLAGAPLLRLALEWLRSRYRRTIVVDTRRLEFVDLAGYRAIDASLRDEDGQRDPRIVHVPGEVVIRLEEHLAVAARTGSPRLS